MGEERIIYEVDDSQLDIAIAKLQQAITLSTASLGSPDIGKGSKSIIPRLGDIGDKLGDIKDNEKLIDILPTVNRELRLIYSQIPGMRQAIALYYRLRRLARGIDIGGFQLYITIIATAILILKYALNRIKEIERREEEYKQFIRREKNWTRTDYENYMGKQKNYFWSIPG